jgi:hypothetical protein
MKNSKNSRFAGLTMRPGVPFVARRAVSPLSGTWETGANAGLQATDGLLRDTKAYVKRLKLK